MSSALESKGEKSSKLGPPIRALDNDVNHVKQGGTNSPASDEEKEPGPAIHLLLELYATGSAGA